MIYVKPVIAAKECTKIPKAIPRLVNKAADLPDLMDCLVTII